jgi:DNA-directed RNA polymerase subunit N (RpoN/RPB10)
VAESKTSAKHNLVDNDVGDLENETAECKALNLIELNRYCCRRHILGHTDIIDLL